MIFRQWLEEREMGRSLPETGYPSSQVTIYRAVAQDVTEIKPEDYVTLSEKFARGHADHMVVTEEEPYVVLKALVNASDVYEAYNPGEYFYNGPPTSGQSIYTVSPPEPGPWD